MFIQYLAEQGHNIVKSERKPRRNIQYRDLGMGSTLFLNYPSPLPYIFSFLSHFSVPPILDLTTS